MIRKIGLIGRTYRHIHRYREIISVLAKYGFSDLVASAKLEKYIDLGRKIFHIDKGVVASLSRWQRIRKALEELGPTFIKFGQVMSNRPDMLPLELIAELEKLQDLVPPFPGKDACAMVEKELGKPVNEVFTEFSDEPVASASIAQVHRAVLPGGDAVAVKIQRPGIESVIDVDLEIMLDLALLIEKHIHSADLWRPVAMVEEFEQAIRGEVDFTKEASNIERFGVNFQRDDTLYIPKVYREYSSKRVLTMEYLEGRKISDINWNQEKDLNAKVISSRGANIVLTMVFDHGFFHADPHPGNFIVLPMNVIGLLDFGMVGTISSRQREHLSTMIVGLVNKDARRITSSLIRLSGAARVEAADRLENEISKLIEQYLSLPLRDIKLNELLDKVTKLIVRYQLPTVPDFFLLVRALVTIEGIARRLDPNFDMVEHIKPFAKRLVRERMSPHNVVRDLYMSASDFGLLLRDLPLELREIVEQIKQGRLRIEFVLKGLNPMLHSHEGIANRIVFALVLAALVVGSSIIVFSGVPPKWHDIPIIGIVGFLWAALTGIWLLISILRSRKL